jgi:hypothetical protein
LKVIGKHVFRLLPRQKNGELKVSENKIGFCLCTYIYPKKSHFGALTMKIFLLFSLFYPSLRLNSPVKNAVLEMVLAIYSPGVSQTSNVILNTNYFYQHTVICV